MERDWGGKGKEEVGRGVREDVEGGGGEEKEGRSGDGKADGSECGGQESCGRAAAGSTEWGRDSGTWVPEELAEVEGGDIYGVMDWRQVHEGLSVLLPENNTHRSIVIIDT